nr:MAG TPA: hypothetical protein [Caudoviricetes sp.]
MDDLKTASGKAYPCDYFNPSETNRQLNLRVVGMTVVSAAAVFSNPEETMALRYGGIYASGFTKLVAIVPEGDAIRVVLGKE